MRRRKCGAEYVVWGQEKCLAVPAQLPSSPSLHFLDYRNKRLVPGDDRLGGRELWMQGRHRASVCLSRGRGMRDLVSMSASFAHSPSFFPETISAVFRGWLCVWQLLGPEQAWWFLPSPLFILGFPPPPYFPFHCRAVGPGLWDGKQELRTGNQDMMRLKTVVI